MDLSGAARIDGVRPPAETWLRACSVMRLTLASVDVDSWAMSR